MSVDHNPRLAEILVDALKAQGVERLFGLPGGGSSLDIMEAARAIGLDFVLTRGETAATFMAAVTGELTDTIGVALVGVGPGAASAVNGVAYAQLERSPLILLCDGPASSLHQAFDQSALFHPVTKLSCQLTPDNCETIIKEAIETARSAPRGAVMLELTAIDAQSPIKRQAFEEETSAGTGPLPRTGLDQAQTLLAQARYPVILVGLEARSPTAASALLDWAEQLACPIMSTYKAKGCFPETHPLFAGLFTGAQAEREILERADLIIGYGLDPIEIIPGAWPYEAPVLELRLASGPVLPGNGAMLLGPLGEKALALHAHSPVSQWKEAEITALRASYKNALAIASEGFNVAQAMEKVIAWAPKSCRLTVDAGAHMFSTLDLWPSAEPFSVFKSNGLSSMGYALPAAIASSLMEPDRLVIAVTGDGGMMMMLSELATAVERRCNILCLVMNDAALSLIDIKQQRQQRPVFGVRNQAIDFAALALALGCSAWRVRDEEGLSEALQKYDEHKGVGLIDISVDPGGYAEQLARLRG